MRKVFRYTPKGAPCKSEAILVARLIMSGDLGGARALNCSSRSRSVSEARAIGGACRAYEKMYGIRLDAWTLESI